MAEILVIDAHAEDEKLTEKLIDFCSLDWNFPGEDLGRQIVFCRDNLRHQYLKEAIHAAQQTWDALSFFFFSSGTNVFILQRAGSLH